MKWINQWMRGCLKDWLLVVAIVFCFLIIASWMSSSRLPWDWNAFVCDYPFSFVLYLIGVTLLSIGCISFISSIYDFSKSNLLLVDYIFLSINHIIVLSILCIADAQNSKVYNVILHFCHHLAFLRLGSTEVFLRFLFQVLSL